MYELTAQLVFNKCCLFLDILNHATFSNRFCQTWFTAIPIPRSKYYHLKPNWIRKRFDSIRSVWGGTPGLAGVSKALVAITQELSTS